MRFLVIIKANEQSEAGEMPSEQVLTEMEKFNEELVNAGVMLSAEGLHPSRKAAKVKWAGGKKTPTVIDARRWTTRSRGGAASRTRTASTAR